MRRGLAIALACGALAACAPRAPAAGPDARAERVYRAHCASCHRLKDPSEHAMAEWSRAVDKYGPRAHLSSREMEEVREYLMAYASDAAAAARR